MSRAPAPRWTICAPSRARCERLLPGEGGIELRPLFDALPSDLPVSVEVPHAVRLAQLGQTEWARQALATSRARLEPQGARSRR